MNRIFLPLLTSALSLAPVLCWAAEPKAEGAKAIAVALPFGWLAVEIRAAKEARAAVETIGKFDGVVQYGHAMTKLIFMLHLGKIVACRKNVNDHL